MKNKWGLGQQFKEGNVGTGTTSPSEKLEVSDTNAKSFEVKPESGYVTLLVSGTPVARLYE